MSPTLPPDWSEFLEDVHQRLAAAIAAADARSAQMPIDVIEGERPKDTARLEDCLSGLSGQLEAADQLVREVDIALLTSEQVLRQYLETSASLRQKVLDSAGQAIG